MGILILFLFALILRLILAPLGFHIDILSNAGWGQWIFENGPKGFYENGIWIYSWPTQPPLVSLLYGFDRWLYINLLELFRWMGHMIVQYRLAPGHLRFWFEFTKWFDTSKLSTEATYSTGYLISIKILPILADLGIAGVLYALAKKIKGIKNPLIWPGIYLISPFSFYLSALWGQYDQLGFLPVLIAFILESNKKLPWLTPLLFAVGIAIKPTSLILIPIFIYIYFKNRHKIINPLIGIFLVGLLFFATTQVFTDKNVIAYSYEDLYTKIFQKAAPRLSANAFNFWRILQSSSIETQESKVLFIPAYIWSLIFYLTINFIAVKKIREVNTKNVVSAVFIISAGSWLFMTNMLDRYFFAAVVSGLFTVLYDKKLFKYWLILSLIFTLNLYNQWWFPDSLEFLKRILEWQGALITKILAGLNVILYLKMARRLVYN